IWHLLTHTSGMTYSFHYAHPVDAMYRSAGFDLGKTPDLDLAGCVDAWARLPLLFEPGSSWNYSVATDVVGRLVELISGQSLDEFFDERILGPLGMTDTSWWVPEDKADRLAALYTPDFRTGKAHRGNRASAEALSPPRALMGGGGLMSTAADYMRFCEMLRGRGELGGTRILGPRTVDYMTVNHLPGNLDMADFGTPINAEAPPVGMGFGLGFGVVIDPAASKVLSSRGEYSWGGAASTGFFIDPREDLVGVFMTQLLPSGIYPLRSQMRQLVNQAIVD
ncbi:MAG TPA: serine hydrolase domain-containing protein, partial [Acidimicrobiales bacterium]|nr:serine hydrolase domain-containing protein [Acidimicrobiales bacterium]